MIKSTATTRTTNTITMEQKKIQHHAAHHAVIVRRKLTALIAFTTTMFLLCVENVKAFTAPLSAHGIVNENTLLLVASGAHSLAKRWNKSTGESSVSIRLAASRFLSSPNHAQTAAFAPISPVRAQRNSLTSLRMAFSFGMPPPSVPMLDMKTSLNAFGGWYNKMDPVARPPVYDE